MCLLYLFLLLLRGGVVLLSDELPKDVYEAFRVSFVRHELQRMYLAKDEGRCYLLAHCTVAECDSQQKELADDARKFPLGEPHQELEVCQYSSSYYNKRNAHFCCSGYTTSIPSGLNIMKRGRIIKRRSE